MVRHSIAAEDVYDIDQLLDCEWLLANGTGGYAMGSVAGCNTRRYHGLLVAAANPPTERIVVLNQVLETLTLNAEQGAGQSKSHHSVSQSLELGTCLFQDEYGQRLFVPQGYCYLKDFDKDLSATWTYSWGSLTFTRRLVLHWKRQAATLHYRITGLAGLCNSVTLQVQPLLTLRDFHSLLRSDAGNFKVEPVVQLSATESVLTVDRGGHAATFCCSAISSAAESNSVSFNHHEDWWYNHYYPVEKYRGLDDLEDLFTPGSFVLKLASCDVLEAAMTVQLGLESASHVFDSHARSEHLERLSRHYLNSLKSESGSSLPAVNDELVKTLVAASDDFVVDVVYKGRTLSTVIAGYPWFADWGRDTFISMPGLLLCTGRLAESREVLQVFAEAIKDGLVANNFDERGAAHYNTVDASLWFIHAAMEYVNCSGDRRSWDDWLARACIEIVDAYREGTRFNIKMDDDGLVSAGGPDTQLTWMDAACGTPGTDSWIVFTPRYGKAVEINALWYSALSGLTAMLSGSHADKASDYGTLAKLVKQSFTKTFWSDELGYLIDHIWTDCEGVEHADCTIRPNQIFACSLACSPLSLSHRRKVVDTVGGQLLTPLGLRTLPPDDPNYFSRYGGDQFHRDRAYHQGTVWGWLIGPYAESILRLGKFSSKSRSEALQIINPLLDFLMGDGLGQINEIFEGDTNQAGKHRPVGCIAQAWSVAEVMRVVYLVFSS